jgi:hypothetical protein
LSSAGEKSDHSLNTDVGRNPTTPSKKKSKSRLAEPKPSTPNTKELNDARRKREMEKVGRGRGSKRGAQRPVLRGGRKRHSGRTPSESGEAVIDLVDKHTKRSRVRVQRRDEDEISSSPLPRDTPIALAKPTGRDGKALTQVYLP